MTKTILPIKLKKSDEMMTGHSGLLVVGEALKATGIEMALRETLPLPLSNRGKHPATYLIPTLLSMAGGGRTLEDVQKVLSDKVLSDQLSLDAFDASTHSKWLRSKGKQMRPYIQSIITDQITKGLERSGHDGFTADIDAMMIESEKCTAKKTYKGFRGYTTMLGFFAETRHCGYQAFRPGNTSPARGILTALKGMRSVCPNGKDIARFRSDSAGWSREVIGYCDDTNITYTVTADMNVAVKRAIADIPESEWTPILDDDGHETGREVAETVYCFDKGHCAHRLIVQRSSTQQMDLFADGRQGYYAISTNASWPPEDIIRFHNKRGQAENYNKEFKESLHMDYLPSNDFESNRLWFSLAVLIYNLFQCLKNTILPSSWRHKKIATLRWQLIQIPGRLVYHARQWTLNVGAISHDIVDIIQTLRRRLCLL